MNGTPEPTERLRGALAKLIELTTTGELHWERQAHSSHRYSKWKNNLLIIGPELDPDDRTTPRYLFLTPFDSPDHIEINSENEALGHLVLALVDAVNAATAGSPSTDPFAVSDSFLDSLTE
jgi:hypothetical protein